MQKNRKNLTKQEEKSDSSHIVALAGSPNVGKSTVFNNLTGLRRHTGNWCGKTVDAGAGEYKYDQKTYTLVDLPGTYSLYAHSEEERVARDFLCFDKEHCATVIVCDGSALSRSLSLVLQILEITDRAVLCVNLLDEAKRKHVSVDLERLSQMLGIPVVGTVAHDKKSLEKLKKAVGDVCNGSKTSPLVPVYSDEIEEAVLDVSENLTHLEKDEKYLRWAALRIIEGGDGELTNRIISDLTYDDESQKDVILSSVNAAKHRLSEKKLKSENIRDVIAGTLVSKAEDIACRCQKTVATKKEPLDLRLDRIFTGKVFAFPVMLLLLLCIFWITVTGANYPSELLSGFFTSLEAPLYNVLNSLHVPEFLSSMLVFGMYRVLSWVVSVMLPPMAIFFPMFTLLEDSGYLPRIAFNLDRPFKCCKACGKQALTM